MFKNEEEHTLFKPAPMRPGEDGGGRAPQASIPMMQAPAARGGGGEDDEGLSLGELLLFAFRSAQRRKVLTGVVFIVGLALTVAGVNLAPKTYSSSGEILVVKKEENNGWNPEGKDREVKQWEGQIRARPNLENIIKDAQLVEKWDDMRQPHRRLLDRVGQSFGSAPPSKEQKKTALVQMLAKQLGLKMDPTSLELTIDWSDPEISRDVAQAAMTRFIDKRYETEVGTIPAEIQVAEENLEKARLELEKLSPSTAPAKEKPTVTATPASQLIQKTDRPVDPELPGKLAKARERQQAATTKLNDIEAAQNNKIAQIQGQLTERSSSLGPAHPEIVQLKSQLDNAKKETAEHATARDAKQKADAEVSDLAAQAGVSLPKVLPSRLVANPIEDKKIDPQTQAKIDDARQVYNTAKAELNKKQNDLKFAELDFKRKYTVSRPPEVPFGPKKPVGLMVGIGGVFATIMLALLFAALRDRATGLIYESKHVKDILRVPVLGDIKDANFHA
jgi:uncharacterized protein involved in exopolysaccharide biosynthesis